jgi:putative DNA primase/helicase
VSDRSAHDDFDNSVLAWAYRYVHAVYAVLVIWGVLDDLTCECRDPHDGVGKHLSPNSIGKHPVGGRSWTDGTTDLARIEKWFPPNTLHNIAIVPAYSGLGVIDIDGELGEKDASGFYLPPTLEATTGNGRHLYYAVTDPTTIPSGDLTPNINTRFAKGYVLAPPSRHRSGGSYVWKNWGAQ